MSLEATDSAAWTIWRVVRRFDGEKKPEALLRALIQAHKGNGI